MMKKKKRSVYSVYDRLENKTIVEWRSGRSRRWWNLLFESPALPAAATTTKAQKAA